MGIGATGDEIGAALLQPPGERLGIYDHCFGVGFEARLERFAERNGLGRDDVHQRPALESGENRRVDLLGDRFVIGQHHTAARTAQRLVGGGSDDVGMTKRGRILACPDEPGKVRHINHEGGTHLIGNGAKLGEVDVARIGRSAGDDQGRAMLLCKRCNLLKVDQIVIAADAVLDCVEPFARHCGLCAVRQVAAGVETHSQDGVTGFGQRQHHRAIGLSTGMRLDVGEAAVEQLFGALDRQRLDRVRRSAALIVTSPGIALGIFVGQHRALGLEHGARDDILRCDELDLGLLTVEFGSDRFGHLAIGVGERAGEETGWLNVGQVGGSGHLAVLGRVEHVDAALVAAAFEVGGEESGDARLGHLGPDQP